MTLARSRPVHLFTRDLAARLRRQVDGPVLLAGDPGYDDSRTPFFPLRVGRPLAVVRPRSADDVAAVVGIARETGTELSVRGGGHSAAAHSTGDGLLLDLRLLGRVVVDAHEGTAWAGGGLTADAVTRSLHPRGAAVGFGDTGSVAIGGLTLAGGLGHLSRRYGLTIDNLLAVELVTADGRVRTVSADREPDLFWALRGGGGGFGVATRFRYRTAPVDRVHGGLLLLPATPRVLAELLEACAEADDALNAIVHVEPAPPLTQVPVEQHGRPVLLARLCVAADPGDAVRALAPLRSIAPPIADLVGEVPYPALFEGPMPQPGHRMAVHTRFTDRVDAEEAGRIIGLVERPGSALRLVQLRVLGGAIARVPADDTAFAHRDAGVMVTAVREIDGDPGAAGWVREVGAVLGPDTDGAYLGFLGPDDADRVAAAYPPATAARLRAVKAAVDPTDLFRGNHGLPPAETLGGPRRLGDNVGP